MEDSDNATKYELEELKKLLDAYLFADLETMAGQESRSGGLGYPMTLTILGGMELVGVLISKKQNRAAFEAFWAEFVKDFPEYEGAEDVFRAMRDSSAHLYLVCTEVRVTKTGENHLTRTDKGHLVVDLLGLLRDFKKTYGRLMNQLLENPAQAIGYQKIRRELTKNKEKIRQFASDLPLVDLQSASLLGGSSSELPGASGTVTSETLIYRPLVFAASAITPPFDSEG